MRGRFLRIVVSGEGLAAHGIWASDGRHAMKADLAGLEDDTAVEDGREGMVGDLHFPVPQLDVPAPLLPPAFVEIDQDVQPAVKSALLDVVEIDMDVQTTPGAGLMDATASQLIVSQEVRDVEHVRQEIEELPAGQGFVELLQRRRKLPRVDDLDLPFFVHARKGPP